MKNNKLFVIIFLISIIILFFLCKIIDAIYYRQIAKIVDLHIYGYDGSMVIYENKSFILFMIFIFSIIISSIFLYIYNQREKNFLKYIDSVRLKLKSLYKGDYSIDIDEVNKLGVLYDDLYKIVLELREGRENAIGDKLKLKRTLEDISHQLKTPLESIEILLNLYEEVKEELGFVTKELNTGGGYGIKYGREEETKPIRYFTDAIMEVLEENCHKHGLERPLVIIEPGRWIVGEAGITLYTIGAIKEIPRVRTYVAIDGGMTDNPRPSLYEAKYKGIIANRVGEESIKKATIAGKCCETGDVLIWDLKVPKIESGDILAILSTGAYNYSMASNYNRIPKPAVVMLSQGKDRLIVKRETYDDILKNEI